MIGYYTIEYLHWSPLVWVIIFIAITILVVITGRIFFRNEYNKISQQSLPFYSGISESKLPLIPANSIYWGFKHALELYFSYLQKIFISDVLDFMQWFIIFLVIVMLIVTGVL